MKPLLRAAKVLSDPTRVRILVSLRGRELCVCELMDVLGTSQSTLSTHLQVIRKADLVSVRRQGKWLYYALKPETETLMEFVVDQFELGKNTDPALRRDAAKLEKRLSLRDGGLCCVGVESCSPKKKRGTRE